MKRPLLVSLILILGLSACTKTIIEEPKEHKPFPTFPTTENVTFAEPHGTVSVADSNPVYTNCQLTWDSVEISPVNVKGATISYEAFSLGGLKNKTVEALINQKIIDKMKGFTKYADITMYANLPGFRDRYPGINNIRQILVYSRSSFCFNNILSIQFAATVLINADNYDFFVYEALNLDLNTGEELTLSDLFVNDSDYQSRLNEQVLFKAQNNTEAYISTNNEGMDQYRYLGGFTGIRGDVGFFLTTDQTIVLLFNANYPEFYNGYGTSTLSVSMKDLKDILALGQRFVHSDESLFTEPPLYPTFNNYLYESPYDFSIRYERIYGIRVREAVSLYKDFTEPFKTLQLTLLEELKQKVNEITDPNVTSIALSYRASPNGEYMNVDGLLVNYGMAVIPLQGTYRADGSRLTLDDVFLDGFDYRTYLKEEIQKYIIDVGFQDTYDPDQVLDSLIPSFMVTCDKDQCSMDLSNMYINDFGLDEGDFGFTINMTRHPEMFKTSPW